VGWFAVNWNVPWFLRRRLQWLDQIPDLDRALVAEPVGLMGPVALNHAVKAAACS